jgi:hypothetical protein
MQLEHERPQSYYAASVVCMLPGRIEASRTGSASASAASLAAALDASAMIKLIVCVTCRTTTRSPNTELKGKYSACAYMPWGSGSETKPRGPQCPA